MKRRTLSALLSLLLLLSLLPAEQAIAIAWRAMQLLTA